MIVRRDETVVNAGNIQESLSIVSLQIQIDISQH